MIGARGGSVLFCGQSSRLNINSSSGFLLRRHLSTSTPAPPQPTLSTTYLEKVAAAERQEELRVYGGRDSGAFFLARRAYRALR